MKRKGRIKSSDAEASSGLMKDTSIIAKTMNNINAVIGNLSPKLTENSSNFEETTNVVCVENKTEAVVETNASTILTKPTKKSKGENEVRKSPALKDNLSVIATGNSHHTPTNCVAKTPKHATTISSKKG